MSADRVVNRPNVFFYYSDSPDRRAALRGGPGNDARRYLLYGLRRFEAEGFGVAHNLVGDGPPASEINSLLRRANVALHRMGAYGGDFPTVLRVRKKANDAEVILSTVDSVGIPLVLLKRAGMIAPPLVYIAIGLQHRIKRIRSDRARNWYRAAFRGVRHFVSYGWEETAWIRDWLGGADYAPEVTFMPFGVDVEYFSPPEQTDADTDVVSMGRDNQRDFTALISLARKCPEVRVKIVTDPAHAGALGSVPPNVTMVIDAPFSEVRRLLSSARVVALSVKENPYSGATTTLLQAMALAKPVVVSRVGAIRDGYGLVDGKNCSLIAPGDHDAFGDAVTSLLSDPGRAASLGAGAREHVKKELSWKRYEERLMEIVAAAL